MPQEPMLHVARFEEMIDRRGREVQWYEASMCSCWNSDSGQPLYTCKACHGKGFVYNAPIASKALLTSLTLNQEWESMAGMFEVGDAVATILKNIPVRNAKGMPIVGQSTANPMFEIGVNDKVVILDDEFKTSEVLVKNMPLGGREPDTLYNQLVTRVKSVRVFDSNTGLSTDYRLGTDYAIDENKVVWLDGGSAPPDYTQYSVTYFHRPTYTVIANLPKPRHQDGQDFPRYVALRYMSGMVERP